MKDDSKPKKERRVKIGDIIFIVILFLMSGIRGYSHWMWSEYKFTLVVIAAIVYSWITGDRSLMEGNRRFHQETHQDGEYGAISLALRWRIPFVPYYPRLGCDQN